MNKWRKFRAIVILVLILAFCWFAHAERTKTKIPAMSKRIDQLEEVEAVFAYTVSILSEDQKKICAEATVKQLGPKPNGITPQEIRNLFGIPKDEEKTEEKGGEK